MSRLKALFSATEPEYQAALNGLNIFFGAILGVGMAGVETLDPLAFMTLLVMVAGIVVGILYIPASRHRLIYAAGIVLVLVLIWLTHGPDDRLFGSIPLPDKLIPTLIVWTLATIVVEFGPRKPAPPAVPPP